MHPTLCSLAPSVVVVVVVAGGAPKQAPAKPSSPTTRQQQQQLTQSAVGATSLWAACRPAVQVGTARLTNMSHGLFRYKWRLSSRIYVKSSKQKNIKKKIKIKIDLPVRGRQNRDKGTHASAAEERPR